MPKTPPVGGFSEQAKLDQQGGSGTADHLDVYFPMERSGSRKRSTLVDFGVKTVGYGAFGLAAGLALSDFTPVGAAVGAGLGAYVAWNATLRKNSGKVRVQLDDQVRETRWYGNTNSYERSPEEKQAKKIMSGEIGENIPAYVPEQGEIPDSRVSE